MQIRKISLITILLLVAAIADAFGNENNSAAGLPNVILIVADDLGYGDLSCYGQKKFQTPEIDKLAAEGMQFSQHYAGAPVCAPSRSALLTARHTGHTTIRGNKKVNKYGDFPLSATDTILPQLFKEKGYTTAMFGKWGLGYPGSSGDVSQKGFDSFFGYYGHLAAHNYHPEKLYFNNQPVAIPQNKKYSNQVYAPAVIHDSVLTFMERNSHHPFFLYIPTVIPHAELAAPSVYLQEQLNKYGTEHPYKGIKTLRFATKFGAYDAQYSPKAAFAAMLQILDKQVGEIVASLKQKGIYENTIIIITSDNGPHKEGGAQPDYFNSNAGLRGYKRDLYEGGIRVPLIVHWPEKIKPGKSNLISANWDLMPTLADIIQAEMPAQTDGVSLLPTLLQLPEKQVQHSYLYWEFHEQVGKQAIRMNQWKAVVLNAKQPKRAKFELYNLQEDPSEKADVSATYPQIVEMLKKLILQANIPSPDFPF